MQYYLIGPGDTEQDALNEANLLGEVSFKYFWAGSGLGTLMKIVETEPEILEVLRIINEKGKTLTVADFLFEIRTLKVLMK